MTEYEFRKSETHREELRAFLNSATGREFMNILFEKSLPRPLTVAGKISSNDQIRAMGLVAIFQDGWLKCYRKVKDMAELPPGGNAEPREDFDYLTDPLLKQIEDAQKQEL